MTGGVNWGGTAADPKLDYIFVNSKDAPSTGWITPNPSYNPRRTMDKEFPYMRESGARSAPKRAMRTGESLGTCRASVRHGRA